MKLAALAMKKQADLVWRIDSTENYHIADTPRRDITTGRTGAMAEEVFGVNITMSQVHPMPFVDACVFIYLAYMCASVACSRVCVCVLVSASHARPR